MTIYYEKPLDPSLSPDFAHVDSTMTISDSSRVVLENLDLEKVSLYPEQVIHKIARALTILSSSEVQLRSSSLSSNGKQTLYTESSDTIIKYSDLQCYYFCVNVKSGSHLIANNSFFTIDHKQELGDQHAATWVANADMIFNESSFKFVTGIGIVAGLNGVDNRIVINGGSIINPSQMWAWIPTHQNYVNLKVYITGTFSPVIRPYFCISWLNPTCFTGKERGQADPGTELHLRANSTDSYRSVSLPPASPEGLLFVNSDAVQGGGAFSIQRLALGSNVFQGTFYKDWSEIPLGSYSGWLDQNDRIVSGDFLGHGRKQILFLNADTEAGGGAIRIQELDPSTKTLINQYWKDWSEIPGGAYSVWLDPKDRIVSGDFLGNGRTQLLFFNTNPAQAGEAAILIQEFDSSQGGFQTQVLMSWSEIPNGFYDGWIDSSDQIVAGDFLGDGKTQLLFFNVDPTQAEGGAIRIQEFDLKTSSFVTRFQENWSDLRTFGMGGWLDSNDRLVAGNFLAWEADQLLLINTDPNHVGGAMRILEFDWVLNGFVTRFWKDWSDIPAETYNGWLDPKDRILSIGYQPELK